MTNDTSTSGQTEAIAMQRELLGNNQDLNNVLATSKKVNPWHQNNYWNMATGLHGVKNLITEILRDNEAIFPLGSEKTTIRPIVIATGMTTEDIHAAILARFTDGTDKYPLNTVKHNLSHVMLRKDKSIGCVQMTNDEDKDRECPRPRMKWYLVQ